MFSPNIINEAYDELNELNEQGETKSYPVSYVEPKRDPKIERIRKLVSDISSILYKIEDSQYDADYGKEDDDIRDEMKKSLTKTMVKMVDRLKNVVEEENPSKSSKESDDKESDDKESDDKESDDKESDDKESDDKKSDDKKSDDKKSDGDEKPKDTKSEKDDDSDDTKDELKKKSKDEIVNQIMKLFPTESVTTPNGDIYSIVEISEGKSILENSDGDKFKVENDILIKWKNN